MKYTNRYGLSPEVVRAITKDRYTVEGEAPSDYSVTDLINPTQLTTLKKRYPEDLVIRDVVSLFYSFMGSVAHQVLEDSQHETDHSTSEERLYLTRGDVVISGKIDCYQHEATIINNNGEEIIVDYDPAIAGERRPPQIRDYKTTKVWNIMKGDHKSWELQTNLYALLLRENNKPVEKLIITCLLFDWKQADTYKQGYPQAPIVDLEMPLWEVEDQLAYLLKKVKELEDAQRLDIELLSQTYPCTEEDCWQSDNGYSIFKKGGQRATKNFDNYAEAQLYFDEQKSITEKTHYIQRRMGIRKRCFEFCDAASICEQHKRLCREEGVPHTYPNHDLHVEPLF